MKICKTESCGRPVLAKGLCPRCYERQPYRVEKNRAREAVRVRDKDQQKAWKQANKDKVAATQKAFHERNPDYHKKWNAKNPGKVALKTRKHYEKATDKALARASRRRSRLISAEGSFTEAEWADMKAKFNHTCPRCQQVKPLSVDHIIPLSRGGSNWISNIQPLCCKCNSSKGTDIIRYQPPALAQ